MENEIWKPIEGYNGHFEVSNTGRVRRAGPTYKSSSIYELTQQESRGYLRVALCYKGKVQMRFVHRLVACAFIPNPDSLSQVNHIDGNKKNNSASNLEWITPKGNIEHSIKMGLRKPGDERANTIIHKETLCEIAGLRRLGLTYSQIGGILNINEISLACRYRSKDYRRYFSEQEFEERVSEFVRNNADKYRRVDLRKMNSIGGVKKKVIKMDKFGNIVGRFDSAKAAAEDAGVVVSAIGHNAHGKSNYCRGYKYVYECGD